MKKFLSMVLCLLLVTFALVSCGEEEIGKQLADYENKFGDVNKQKPQVNLNLYIIVEDETLAVPSNSTSQSQNSFGEITTAINTVNREIKDYTREKFNTELNVVYVRASEYDEVVLNAVNREDSNAAHIVLVNSYSLMQELHATGKLCVLDSFLDTTEFGRLNTAIPKPLFEASKITEVRANGETRTVLYTIPNNHTIGEYEYLLIKKDVARDYVNFNESTLLSYKSYEDAADLITAIEAAGKHNVDDLVSIVSGSYEDRLEFEKRGYYCNVVKAPVADRNEAFLSAFAIINHGAEKNERAMEIIYNINMDEGLRNRLQYGVSGTNYEVVYDKDESGENIESTRRIVRSTSENNIYYMNLLYTGNVLKAYYCEELNWTEEVMNNTVNQNLDAVAP